MNISTFFTLFTSPQTYFEEIKEAQQQGIVNALIPFTILLIVTNLFGISREYFSGTFSGSRVGELQQTTLLESNLTTIILIAIVGILVLQILYTFVNAGFRHLGVLLLTEKQGYVKSYDASTRSWMIPFVYQIGLSLLTLPFLIIIQGFILEIFIGILSLIVSIASTVHYIYAEAKGLSTYHDISFGRGLGASLIGFGIDMLLFVLIFIGVVLLVLGTVGTIA